VHLLISTSLKKQRNLNRRFAYFLQCFEVGFHHLIKNSATKTLGLDLSKHEIDGRILDQLKAHGLQVIL
jgi:hypothetical protein